MIGLIIVTHAGLATELLAAAESIVGPVPYVSCFAVDSSVDLDIISSKMQLAVDEVGVTGDGVLIMTDLFGGTPANVSARFLKKDVVEVVNGVNLPMLIKFSSSRESMSLTVLAGFMKNYGQKSIVLTSDILCNLES